MVDLRRRWAGVLAVLAGRHATCPGLDCRRRMRRRRRGSPGPVASAAASSPALLVGGVLGWFIIRPVNAALGWFFRGFNRVFDRDHRAATAGSVGRLLRLSVVVLLVYGGLLGLTVLARADAPRPASFPMQDKGYLLVNVQLPDSASVERTRGR